MAAASSSSSHGRHSSNQSTEPYYSNDDVGIIHNIVILAQQLLPTLPEHERFPTTALFSAYYDILPRNGISTIDESKFSRILFKIGGLRGDGTLLEKFEEILARMGIDVEFTKDVSSDITEEDHGGSLNLPQSGGTKPHGERRRRNSESSKWGFGTGHESTGPTRRNSFSAEPYPQFAFNQPNPSLLDVKASLIRQRNLRTMAKRQLENWKWRAMELREDNLGLETIARHRDRKVLLLGALGDWRSKLEAKQSVFKTERALIALARRHIVRMRVFQAWKTLVVANRLKQRQFLARKYFAIWKEKIDLRIQQQKAAEAFYTLQLRKKVFGIHSRCSKDHDIPQPQKSLDPISGFWTVLDQNLPRKPGLPPMSNEIFKHNSEKDHNATRGQQEPKATIEVWRQRAQQEEKAAQIDRTKILREAWINWQDKIRAHIVLCRVNARIVSECMYSMVVAVRALAFKRKVDERIKREIFESWIVRAQAVKVCRLAQEAKAQSHLDHERKSFLFRALGPRLEQQLQRRGSATNFNTPRVLQEKVNVWTKRAQHLQELDRWSSDANYFFLTSKSLNKWKTATETSKREKRKQAYVQIRRMKKKNLARGILRLWRDKGQDLARLKEQVDQVVHNRTVILGMDMLDRWRGRSEEVSEMEVSARSLQKQKTVSTWRERTTNVQRLGSEAIAIHTERQEGQALKKWSLEALKIRAQSNYALDIYEKNSKRTFRRVFTYWQQKPALQRPPDLRDSHRAFQPGSTVRASTRRAELVASRRAYGSSKLVDIPEVIHHGAAARVGARKSLLAPQRKENESEPQDSFETFQLASAAKLSIRRSEVPLPQEADGPVEPSDQQFAFGSITTTVGPARGRFQLPGTPGPIPFGEITSGEASSDNGEKEETIEVWGRGFDHPQEHFTPAGFPDTPSKRAIPMAASTTPAALLSTPYERRLRAQYSGGPIQSFRRSRMETRIKQDVQQRDTNHDGK